MPRLKAQVYNTAITPAFTGRNRNFWEDFLGRKLQSDSNREWFQRRKVRNYRTWLWTSAEALRAFGSFWHFSSLCERIGWGTAAAVMAVVGVTLGFLLRATSYGD
jgi:hypothetical protein